MLQEVTAVQILPNEIKEKTSEVPPLVVVPTESPDRQSPPKPKRSVSGFPTSKINTEPVPVPERPDDCSCQRWVSGRHTNLGIMELFQCGCCFRVFHRATPQNEWYEIEDSQSSSSIIEWYKESPDRSCLFLLLHS